MNVFLVFMCLFFISADVAVGKEVVTARLDELVVEQKFKARDFATLESWIAQLNDTAGTAISKSDDSAQGTNIAMRQRLIYGIEKLLLKFNLYELTADEKKRLENALNHMNSSAKACYLQDANRWQEQNRKDLKHGEEQVRNMLRDRPEMRKYLDANDPVWQWTVRQFSGEGTGTRILWNNREPSGTTAQHHHSYERAYSENPRYFHKPFREGFGEIQVSSAHAKRDGEDLWHEAVFELNNIQNTPDFQIVTDKALAGKLSKNDYIQQITTLEFDAVKKTALFYRRIWKPNITKRKLVTHEWNDLRAPGNYREWIAQFKKDSRYPWVCYGDAYTKQILPTIAAKQKFEQRCEQLDEVARRWTNKYKTDADLQSTNAEQHQNE